MIALLPVLARRHLCGEVFQSGYVHQRQTRYLIILSWILCTGETDYYVVDANQDQIRVIDLKRFARAGYDSKRNEWLLTHPSLNVIRCEHVRSFDYADVTTLPHARQAMDRMNL